MGSLWEALTGPDVVLEDAVLQGHAVIVKDGLFDVIVPVGHVPSAVPIRDLGSGFLTPGLVDIHSHGAAGCGFSGSDAAGYRTAATRLLDAGVTTVLPTLASASLASFEQSLDYISGLQDVADEEDRRGRSDDYPGHWALRRVEAPEAKPFRP